MTASRRRLREVVQRCDGATDVRGCCAAVVGVGTPKDRADAASIEHREAPPAPPPSYLSTRRLRSKQHERIIGATQIVVSRALSYDETHRNSKWAQIDHPLASSYMYR